MADAQQQGGDGHHHHHRFNNSEHSLRRSFVAIHQSRRTSNNNNSCSSPTSPMMVDMSRDSNNNHGTSTHHHQPLPFTRNNNTKIREFSRRNTHSGTAAATINRRVSIETLDPPSADELQRNNTFAPRRKSSQPSNNKNKTINKQRRSSYTAITANTAQEMVAEITSNKLNHHERRHSTTAAIGNKQQPVRRVSDERRASVSFAPSLDVNNNDHRQMYELRQQHYHAVALRQSSSSSQPSQQSASASASPVHQGFRSDYTLGEYAKSPSHIIQPHASAHTLHATSSTALSLQKHDFAFVKRSNGHYSYAILAYRTSSSSGDRDSPSHHNDSMKSIDIKNGKGGEEGMAFVMDNLGSTKMIRKKHWAEYVRLVAPQEEEEEEDVIHHNVLGKPISRSANHQDDDDDDDVMLCQEIPIVCQEIVPPPTAHQQGINHPQDMEAEEEEVYLGGAKDDEACPLPSMISFIPSNGANNEECSLISSVSDRARRVDRESIK